MTFQAAISTCLSNYASFGGRASRSEFWWFYLFVVLAGWGATLVGNSGGAMAGDVLSSVVHLAFLIPSLAVGSRRLHDIGRSGWWQLLALTFIGIVVLIVWWATASQPEDNTHGAAPYPAPQADVT